MNEDPSHTIGQVVQADIAGFTAGWPLHQTPPLGSLLKVEEAGTIYAVVCNARTRASTAVPLSPASPGDGLESYLEKHPHLRHLLQTTCDAVVVGHQDADARSGAHVHHYLPPRPLPSSPPSASARPRRPPASARSSTF